MADASCWLTGNGYGWVLSKTRCAPCAAGGGKKSGGTDARSIPPQGTHRNLRMSLVFRIDQQSERAHRDDVARIVEVHPQAEQHRAVLSLDWRRNERAVNTGRPGRVLHRGIV